MKVTKRNLAKTVTLALVMASAVSVASAAELTSQDVTSTINGGGASYTLATDNVTISSDAQNTVLENANITIGAGQTLTLTSTTDGIDYYGVLHQGNVNAEGQNNGKLVINQNEQRGNAIGYWAGTQKIYVDEFVATADSGCAIYANTGDNYTIDAKKITLNAAYTDESASAAGIYATGEVTLQNFESLNITVKNNHTTDPTEGGPAIIADAGGKVTLNGKNIVAKSEGRAAIAAVNNADVNITVDTLDVSASNLAGGSEARKNSVIGANVRGDASEGGLIDITVNEMFKVSGDDSITNAIGVSNDSEIKITSNGVTQVDGDLSAQDTASLTIGFKGNDSYLNGQVNTDDNATTNFAFSDGALWQNTGDSTVTNLTTDGGIIDFGEGVDDTIEVGTLNGDDLTIRTESGLNSFIVNADSNTDIRVQAGSDFMRDYEEGLADLDELVAIVNIDGTEGANVSEIRVAEGQVYGEITADVSDGVIDESSIQIRENTTNAGMIDMTALSLVSWRGEFDDLNSRLGDLRSSREDNGLWTRFTRGENSYGSVTNRSSMYQIGYDRQAGDWTVGLAYSYTDGTSNFADGRGENTHNVVSLYGTKMSDNGSYLDLVAKYGNLDYEYDVVGGAGSADYDTDAYAFSAEVGKRITASTGAWFEPQFQLTYGTVDSVSYQTANDIKVHQDSIDSFVARAGFMAGKPFSKGDIYVKASYLYDFEGEVKGTFANDRVSTDINRDLGGGWWEVGMGLCAHLSDVTHFYLDFEKAFAGEVDTDWKYNAGLRYSF